MEPLGDDELLYIFNKIPCYLEDKRSFAQVSKLFMKVACVSIYWLYICFPDLLFDILPSSPNVRLFQCNKPLSNNHLKLLAQSCPKLQLLNLRSAQDLDPPEPGGLKNCLQQLNLTECDRISDYGVNPLETNGCEAITAEGLWAFSGHQALQRLVLFSCYNFSWEDVESVALTCIRLEYLGLMKRIKTPMPETSIDYDYLQIGRNFCGIDWDKDSGTLFCIVVVGNACSRLHAGDAGIVSLVTSSKNLTHLNLEGCIRVTQSDWRIINLEYLGLMKRTKTPMPGYFGCCGIDWDEDSDTLFW
ncbi:hypothetical protein L1987_16477 [Smallanthus sonchifolius]|uniref:Uncharacterized protein n=1 Tax=Smallanthus sonchifolius TaxID=185202 RepID=A0ACB9J8G1_9ASTR|nr:hypothetical protein L1987_16477 [Smallanthus sonchifolius]